jgi:hypothetical protein
VRCFHAGDLTRRHMTYSPRIKVSCQCPACRKRFTAPSTVAGRQVRCSGCGRRVTYNDFGFDIYEPSVIKNTTGLPSKSPPGVSSRPIFAVSTTDGSPRRTDAASGFLWWRWWRRRSHGWAGSRGWHRAARGDVGPRHPS